MDIMTSALADVDVNGWVDDGRGTVADSLIASLSCDDARAVLACLAAVAVAVVGSVRASFGASSDDLLLAMRRSLAVGGGTQ